MPKRLFGPSRSFFKGVENCKVKDPIINVGWVQPQMPVGQEQRACEIAGSITGQGAQLSAEGNNGGRPEIITFNNSPGGQ